MNTFLNPHNSVSLTGLIDIAANSISLIQLNEDLGEEEIKNIEGIFLTYKNISTVVDVTVPIGGGLSYTVKQWVEPVTDNRVPGLSSLLDYLNTNYRRIDDDSIITNNDYITKNTITPYTKAIHTTTTNTITSHKQTHTNTYTNTTLSTTTRNNTYHAKTFTKHTSKPTLLTTKRKLKTSGL